jgi:adenylate cyclase
MQNLAQEDASRNEEREVTLLFADLRASTELVASLATNPLACEMLGHVLDFLTEAVLGYHGIVVDYYGDGLLAMWNAPADQPEHADLACRAGFQMLERLPEVTEDWIHVIQSPFRLGVGLHTGAVQVGNAGSSLQLKYGPRGPNVHVTRRVEAATKELGVSLLATQPAVQQLSDRFAANRVCRASMPGVRPMNLYALRRAPEEIPTKQAWQVYEEALRHFEEGEFQEAADALAAIQSPPTGDIPVRFLSNEVQRELGSAQRRRSTDRPAPRYGVIALEAK